MGYNYSLRKKNINHITKNLFEKAIEECYRDGITSVAPLGYSGDDIVLYGTPKDPVTNNRKFLISVRNYCGKPELLITDTVGNFLFYGRYHNYMGKKEIAKEFYKIFRKMKKYIHKEVSKPELVIKKPNKVTVSKWFSLINN